MELEMRILVIENVHDFADSLAQLIQFWGHEAIVAYEGTSALERASTNSPDVVLLDLGLPGMSGYEVARQLRRMPGLAQTLLVAVTGYGQPADIQRCKAAGIDFHILKPADPEEIKKVLETRAQYLLARTG
jgi:CheY-like chemotaxis protein